MPSLGFDDGRVDKKQRCLQVSKFLVLFPLKIQDASEQVTRLSSQILFQKLGVSFKLPLAVATDMFDILFFFRRNESSLTYDGKPRLASGIIRLSIIT